MINFTQMIVRPYFYDLWDYIINFGALEGYQFEYEVNLFFKKNDYKTLLEDYDLGKKYFKGLSGVEHEIDLFVYNKNMKELVIGECKTGIRVKSKDIINFVFKCNDVLNIIENDFESDYITRLYLSLNKLPLDGYRICWYYGIIPFEFAVDGVPIYLQDNVFKNMITEIILKYYCDPIDRKLLIDLNNDVRKNTLNIIKKIKFYQEYDWKNDLKIRNNFNELLDIVNNINYKLKQIELYNEPIYDLLVNEILSKKIKSRARYLRRKRYFLQQLEEKVDRINDYIIIKNLLEKKAHSSIIKKIMPNQYLFIKIIKKIINEGFDNIEEYHEILTKHFKIKKSKINQYHYRLFTPALTILNENDIKIFMNFMINIVKIWYTDLNLTLSRHIIKSILRKDILNSSELNKYLKKLNNLVNLPWDINEYDIIKYTKPGELQYLHKFLPYHASSRYLADLINCNIISDMDTYKKYTEYFVNMFWLENDPDYVSVLYSSPMTEKTRNYFISNGIDIITTRRIYYPEYSKITPFHTYAIDSVRDEIQRDIRICDFCGLKTTEHFNYISGISYYLCDKCYEVFFENI